MYERAFDGVPIELHTVALSGETELQEEDFPRCQTDLMGLAVVSYKMAPARIGPNRAGVIHRRNSAKIIDFRAVDGELAEALMGRLGFYLQDQLPIAEVPGDRAAAQAEEEEAPERAEAPERDPRDPQRDDLDPEDLPERDPDRSPDAEEEDGWSYREPVPDPGPTTREALDETRGEPMPLGGGRVVGRLRPKDPQLARFLERGESGARR